MTVELYKKALEIYLTENYLLSRGKSGDIYLDIWSEYSVTPQYIREKYQVEVYEVDIQNKPGIHEYKVGADVANIPFEDNTITGMFLHCSFEHFEGTSDISFIQEINRLLVQGGLVKICPLYLYIHDLILTDPVVSISDKTDFNDEMVFCVPGLWNTYMRLMSPKTFQERIMSRLHPGKMTIYKIDNYYNLSKISGTKLFD